MTKKEEMRQRIASASMGTTNTTPIDNSYMTAEDFNRYIKLAKEVKVIVWTSYISWVVLPLAEDLWKQESELVPGTSFWAYFKDDVLYIGNRTIPFSNTKIEL